MPDAAPDHAPPPPDAAAAAPLGPVVSQITGHRLCEDCGFQLYGANLHREERFGLLLIRCPECGHINRADAPAAVLKRSASIDALAALSLILAKLGVLALVFFWIYGYLHFSDIPAASAYYSRTQIAAFVDFKAQADKIGDPVAAMAAIGIYAGNAPPANSGAVGTVSLDWWRANRDSIIGPTWSAETIRNFELETRLTFVPFFALIGPMIALLVPQRRAVVAATLAAAIAALALAAAVYPIVIGDRPSVEQASFGWVNIWTLAEFEGKRVRLELLAVPFAVALLVGIIFARPGARLIAGLLLQPLLRGPFADLWLASNLPLPGAARPRPRARARPSAG